jgi:ubiquinone/menaquinone biosynthesis C-methylase UbiE
MQSLQVTGKQSAPLALSAFREPQIMSNPFDEEALAKRYENWYAGRGRHADRLEKHLLARLLAKFSGANTVLEVGCGTGHFTRWLAEQGFRIVGLDVSPAMLAEATKRNGVPYVVGDALALPFADRSFDIVALITTLEFVANPQRALSEAVRVARLGLLLGVLNRYSLLAVKSKISAKPPWSEARFFSPGNLVRSLQDVAGTRLARIQWRTTLWPVPGLRSLPLPWGGFIGMAVQLR